MLNLLLSGPRERGQIERHVFPFQLRLPSTGALSPILWRENGENKQGSYTKQVEDDIAEWFSLSQEEW